MPRWKGKQVTRKRLMDLTANAEWRRMREKDKFGFNYQRSPITIGGNKNSKVNRIPVYY